MAGGWSSGPATGRSSNSAAWSRRCAARSTSPRGSPSATQTLSPDQRIKVRTGIHLGDVVEEADGDLMGDGVNIAARLEGICAPGAICLSEDAWRQVRDKIPEPLSISASSG